MRRKLILPDIRQFSLLKANYFKQKNTVRLYTFFYNSYGTGSEQLYICVFQYKKVSGPCLVGYLARYPAFPITG